MKNKGFTLIELLAVIVILAIIALVATPIVMNTIEKSKKEAAERSSENYIRGVEETIAASLTDRSNILEDGVYTVEELTKKGVSSSGSSIEGHVKIKDRQVVDYSIQVGNYVSNYNSITNEKTSLLLSKDNKCSIVSGTGTTVGDEIVCVDEHFRVIYSDENSIQMLAVKNITLDENGPKQSDTAGKITFASTQYWYDSTAKKIKSEYSKINNTKYYDSNSNLYKYVEAYESYINNLGIASASADLLTIPQLKKLGCNTNWYTCPATINWIYSTNYWLGTIYPLGRVWVVETLGTYNIVLNFPFPTDSSKYGVRPLITISKTELNS